MKVSLLLILISFFISACSNLQTKSNTIKQEIDSITQIVSTKEVKWTSLNPARGEKSPKAGNLWGNRAHSQPSGFLVQFIDSFSSPPHIHNVTYRGIVLSGLVHNDDPNAQVTWLPTGSFWTQPAGQTHITAASGDYNLAYIEIDTGPYLVHPAKSAFNQGENPINVHQSNLVWLNAAHIKTMRQHQSSVFLNNIRISFLWGSPQNQQLNGSFIKLPSGFSGKIYSESDVFHAIVAQGQLHYQTAIYNKKKYLDVGSYFGSEGKSIHPIICQSKNECIIYIRTKGYINIL